MVLRAAVVVVLLLLPGIHAVEAQPLPFALEFSGGTLFLIVDGNGDGPGPGDCRYEISLSSNDIFGAPSIRIDAYQDANMPLNLCNGFLSGSLDAGQDDSSDWAESFLDTTDMGPGLSQPGASPAAGLFYYPPMSVEFIDEVFSGDPDGLPMRLNQVQIEDGVGQETFFMEVCSSGGPALKIRPRGGAPVLLELRPYPEGDPNPTHLEMANLPFERAIPNLGQTVFRNAYFPLQNRALTATITPGNGDLILDTSIDDLRACSGRQGAPTATEWQLIALMLALLALGTWSLSRRESFFESLPRA